MLAQRLKQLRESKGKSQQEVCAFLNIEQSTLANYENGKRIPKLEILIKIAEYYQCSLDYLVGIVDHNISEASPLPSDAGLVLDEDETMLINTRREYIKGNSTFPCISALNKCFPNIFFAETPTEKKALISFKKLDEDGQDIIIGKIKELLHNQPNNELPKTGTDPGR